MFHFNTFIDYNRNNYHSKHLSRFGGHGSVVKHFRSMYKFLAQIFGIEGKRGKKSNLIKNTKYYLYILKTKNMIT